MLKVSIVTVCFNSENYIKDAIESVLNQTYKDIEYIIIDGGSIDKTIDIVKSYGNKISKFISEPDKGIYDAMNKGLKLASGAYIGILNSDDFYINNNIIEEIVKQIETNKTDSLYADLIYIKADDTNKHIRYWKSGEFISGSFRKGWHPPHPTFFVKTDLYQKFGYFNMDYALAADFELMLRFLEKEKITTQYYKQAIIKMRLGGATNKRISNIYKQNIECYKAFKKNGLSVSLLYPFLRLLPKITQFFKNKKK
jgi:glycosyltransferase involved in cell wall biosynthesis